ncbi:MAG: L-histidine N(alpha)-methyltransferase [Pseudomonadota bacterium]
MTQALRLPPNVSFRDEHPDLGDGRESILAGLKSTPKRINPMWFYDKRGSELFDEITRLPEYYPTRTEVAILRENAAAISERCGRHCVLLEPGSGSSEKVRLLLEAMRPAAYVPIDISADFLRLAAAALGVDYPWLPIHAVCADFNAGWDFLDDVPEGRRVVFYPGSTLGNLEPVAARSFLERLTQLIGSDGGVLIGVDTHKDSATLDAAYNDSAGTTAAFNLNVLRRLNEMLDADFDLQRFSHRAFYNESLRRIEMHLVSKGDQIIGAGNVRIALGDGETIHTESSYKYSEDGFRKLASEAGLTLKESWYDCERLFGVHYLELA